jgi:hypothetical protein
MDRALQMAKLEFIRDADKQQTLPYYWAPAILIGKTEVIDFHQLIPLKTWVISVTILLFILFIWWLWKKRETFRLQIRRLSGWIIKTGEE